jgi:tripartite-type tricarboxylate transporter receptor subunit TctC
MKKILIALLLASAVTTTLANEVIRLVVPFGVGGPTDKLARLLARDVRELSGRTIIVENRPGAGGEIAANIVSAAPRSDTVLLMFGTPLVFALKPEKFSLSVFPPVASLGRLNMMVGVHPDSTIRTFRDLQNYDSKKSLTYSTSGKGSLSFLVGEMLKTNLNKNMIDVPYPSDAQRMIDILAGRTDIAILHTDQAMKYIQAQQLLPIVSLTDQRDPDLPAVPSIKEFGINDLTVNSHFFIVSNNPTNKENIALIQKTLTQVLNDPILNKPYKAEGLTIAPGSKTLSIEQLQKEISHYQTLIKKANMASE